MQSALLAIASTDGALAETVKKTVTDAVAPLATEVSRLALEFRGENAAEDALRHTTAKGTTCQFIPIPSKSSAPCCDGPSARAHHAGRSQCEGSR